MNISYLKYGEYSSTKSDVLHFADHFKCGQSYCAHFFLNSIFFKIIVLFIDYSF